MLLEEFEEEVKKTIWDCETSKTSYSLKKFGECYRETSCGS